MTVSSFSDIGLDPEDVKETLTNLGIDYSDYEDELSSLSLVTNLVLLQGISNKTSEIEDELAVYQLQVDISSGMQDTLNDLREYVCTSDANVANLVTFLEKDNTYMDITDASTIAIDFTYEGTTYETLQDLFDAIDDGGIIQDWYETLSISDLNDSMNVGAIVNSSGTEKTWNLNNFMSESLYYVQRTSINKTDDSYGIGYLAYDYESVSKYLISQAFQNAGYFNSELYTDLTFFPADSQSAAKKVSSPWITTDIDDYIDDFVDLMELYFGEIGLDYDLSEGTMEVTMNGMAGLRQMGIDLAQYFDDDTSYPLEAGLFGAYDQKANDLSAACYRKAYDYDYDSLSVKDLSSSDILFDDDSDAALEAVSTAIESQSNNTQVAQLKVNSVISEWGEFNDVWDMCHQYIHDAKKRAEDNSV